MGSEIILMYHVSENRPDCKVFVRRLIIPDSSISAKNSQDNEQYMKAFKGYYPREYRVDVIAKSELIAYTAELHLPLAEAQYKELSLQIDELKKEVATLINRIYIEQHEVDELRFSVSVSSVLNTTLQTKQQTLDASQKELNDKTNQLNGLLIEQHNKKIYLDGLLTSIKTIHPVYEPHLLYFKLGVKSFTTSLTRNGIGTANVSLFLPLDENAMFDRVLFPMKTGDIWDLNNTPNVDKQMATPANSMLNFDTGGLSSKDLSIFKTIRNDNGDIIATDRRETNLLPMDMIQIWVSKRYTKTYRFPNDYTVIFTGFIISPKVNFTGGNSPGYTITLQCEDTGKILRQSRANIDPALDSRWKPEELDVTAFQSKLNEPRSANRGGSQIIESLIKGEPGNWFGLSKAEVIDGIINNFEVTDPNGNKQKTPGIIKKLSTHIVTMPTEFENIQFNLYDNFTNELIQKDKTDGTKEEVKNPFAWYPYVTMFKSTFKFWENDYKYRWDMCKEIANITEFEFYVDHMGVINYHPPFYTVNPSNLHYYIDDREILSEDHTFSEKPILTSLEVTSQPSYGVVSNVAGYLSAYVTAPIEIIQRYGLRWSSKNIPIFSTSDMQLHGAELVDNTKSGQVRYLFAKALMNRRNAEVRSASVEIIGNPEIVLCQTMLFVGDLEKLLKKVSLGSIVGQVLGISTVNVSNLDIISDDIKKIIGSFKVYYVSGISHKYTQGSSFTTSLTLTHGRMFDKDYGPEGVGYFVDDKDNSLVKLLYDYKRLNYDKEKGRIDDFFKLAKNYMQFLATGDKKYVEITEKNGRPQTKSETSTYKADLQLQKQVSNRISGLR